MIARLAVGGLVADQPQLMKQVGDLSGHQPVDLQAAQQIDLEFLGGGKDAGPGGELLGEEFAELAQLDQAGVRIVAEITLGQRAQARELGVVVRQESEIG